MRDSLEREGKMPRLGSHQLINSDNHSHHMLLTAARNSFTMPFKSWVFVGGIWSVLFSLLLFMQVSLEIKKQEQIFQQNSTSLYELIRQRLAQNEAVLGGLEALFHTFDQLKFDGVRGYAKEMLSRYPHIYTVGLQSRVDLAQLAEFESEAGHSIRANYRIRDFGLDDERSWRIAAQRPFYYPVTFMEPPIPQASPVMGLDVYADKKLGAAIDESILTQKMVSSAPFQLVEGGRGYVLFKALFNTPNPSRDAQTRQRQATRMVSLLISAEKLLHPEELPSANIMMRLYHQRYRPHDLNGQIYSLNSIAIPLFVNRILPLFFYRHGISSEFQPFIFETQRQIGWEVVNWTRTIIAAIVTLFLTLLGVAAINLRRIQLAETRMANELLFREKDRALVTLHSINDAVITFDSEGHIDYVNPAAEVTLQSAFSAAKGKLIGDVMNLHYELSTSPIANPFCFCILSQCVVDLPDNTILLNDDGQKKLIEGSVFDSQEKIIGAVVAFRDMGSVRKKALEAVDSSEKRLRQHQAELAHVARLNTMGEMASGIAHEINQPLAAILSYNQACIRMLQSEDVNVDDIIHAMKSAATQSKRAGEIISRLRAFVGKNSNRSVPVDFNQVVQNVLLLSEHHLSDSKVIVHLDLATTLPFVIADAVGMEQVVLNLIRNGMEAMKELPNQVKTIHIETSLLDERVVIKVRDHGHGISADDMNHLFDPFFTTKKEGMGLGLTISYSIVETYGGTLTAKNHPDGGAEFSFSLAARDTDAIYLDIPERS
jgi:signal transduction histidine kinase/CHASE1-domain containing sensor protein